jgi:hypothetical protein
VTAPFFSRERIVAPPGWSGWLVPPAALAIHLSIGAAYSWSVFKKPLEGALDISADVEFRDYQSTVPKVYIVLAWLWVAIPFAYGVFELTLKVKQLF